MSDLNPRQPDDDINLDVFDEMAAKSEEEKQKPDSELEYQREERPELTFGSAGNGSGLVSSTPNEEITVASESEGEPELASSVPDEAITIVFNMDDVVSSVPEPEQEEPVLAEDSSGTPVEESEPPEEPGPEIILATPDPPDDADDSGLPYYETVVDPPFDLSASAAEPDYELNLDLDEEQGE